MICFSSANFSFVNFSNKVIYKVIWRFIAHLQTNQNFSVSIYDEKKAVKLLDILDVQGEQFSSFPPFICLVTGSDYIENCSKLEMLKYF